MNKPTVPRTLARNKSCALLTLAFLMACAHTAPATSGWDLVLFSYTGTRKGEFDGGPENPRAQVTLIGAQADLVYDDAGKQVKLTNFRR